MKKVNLIFCVVFGMLSMACWAQNAVTAAPDNPGQQVEGPAGSTRADAWKLQGGVWTEGSCKMPDVQNRGSRAPARSLAAGKTLLYAEYYNNADGIHQLADLMDTVVTSQQGGTAQLNGLYVGANKMTMTYTASTVTIAVQVVYNHPTYGPVYICPIDWDKKTYSTTDPLQGTIDAQGNIHLGSWGLFLISGQYKGGTFGTFKSTDLMATNAVMTNVYQTPADSVETYPVYIEQPRDNQVSIVNFGGTSVAVNAYVNPDKTVEIVPQFIYSTLSRGDFMCFPANWAKSTSYIDASIEGTATDTEIDLGNWGVFNVSNKKLCPYPYKSSKIEYASGVVSFPQKSVLDWTGSGTEADPYVIKTPDQLTAFAQSVTRGNSYGGKWVTLGADIDMNKAASAYRPAGNGASHQFQGTFDGKGYTIRHLDISAGKVSYTGLFAYAGDSAALRNVNLDSLSLTSYGTYAGGLVAYSKGNIDHVQVTHAAIVHHNSYGGGIVGYVNKAKVSDCAFDGTIAAGGITGGIAGYANYSSLLRNHAAVSMSYDECFNQFQRGVGGIVGHFSATVGAPDQTLAECYATGSVRVSVPQGVVGGIVGNMSGNMTRCFSNVAINAQVTSARNGMAGGLAGMISGAKLADCYTSNEIVSSGNCKQVGGLVGYMLDNSKTTNTLDRCLNTGQVIMATATGHEGLYGIRFKKTVFTGCYYDKQITNTALDDSLSYMAATTSQLTSGVPLTGYSTDVWTFKKGLYPQLKALAGTDVSNLSVAPVMLADGETTTKVKTAFTVSTQNGIDWYVYENDALTKNATGLVINDSTVTLTGVSAPSLLVGTTGNGKYIKLVNVKTANPTGLVGTGTESDPYLIQSKEDLIALNAAVTSSTSPLQFTGDYFRQTCDIDCQGDPAFQGVGDDMNKNHTFDGTYDGGGYAIHNFVIDSIHCDDSGKAVRTKSRRVAGFFGYCNKNSVIKNLTLANDCKVRAFEIAGGIAAVTLGRIENCRNNADVTTIASYSAGIVAQSVTGSVITGCYNAGTITSSSSVVGGIVAVHAGTVEYCQNDGEVHADSINSFYSAKAQRNVGGIAGQVSGSKAVVQYNINTGYVHTLSSAGGIASTSTRGAVMRCNINYGLVDASSDDGQEGAVAGATLPEETSWANYYDRQIAQNKATASGEYGTCTGLLTATLTSGKALDSLDADKYNWQKGMYPVLTAFRNEPAANAHRKMVVTLDSAETIDNMTRPATLNQLAGMTWTLKQGVDYKIDNRTLSVTLKADSTSLRDTLVATYKGYTKAIPLRTVPKLWDGDGTAASPYQIKTVADMNTLSRFTTAEQYSFEGNYFKVMNDIDFSTQANFVPVAGGSAVFEADFDGNGKTLSHVTINHDKDEYQGLFGTLGAKAGLHDLTLADVNVTGYRYLGAFAGRAYCLLENLTLASGKLTTPKQGYAGGIVYALLGNGMAKNCVNKGNVAPAGGYIGGIVGSMTGKNTRVADCVNEANLDGARSVGGIACNGAGTIVNCTNKGNISGGGSLGGIVSSNSCDSIVNCVNYGTVTGTGSNVGGVIGYGNWNKTCMTVAGCHNEGDVTGTSQVGGFAGYMQNAFVVADCYNTGAVTASGADCGGLVGSFNYRSSAGGDARLERCYNTGLVAGSGKRVGGLAGDVSTGIEFSACYNTGDVLGGNGDYVGGLAGYCRTADIIDCWNAGNVEASGSAVAGIAGFTQGRVQRCANVGNVTCTSATGSDSQGNAAGLVAHGVPEIADCYNQGDVSGPQLTAGLMATVGNSSTVMNRCYSTGNVHSAVPELAGAVAADGDYVMMGLDSVYYDRETYTGRLSSTDSMATGLTTRELSMCDSLGAAFQLKEGFYPTLVSMAGNALLDFYAATPVLGPLDTRDNVHGTFVVGTPEGTVWTASPAIVTFDGVNAIPTATGEVTITKTMGELSKSYKLTIASTTGVDGAVADSPVLSVTYYDLQGREVDASHKGVLVKVVRYQNGVTRASKQVVR